MPPFNDDDVFLDLEPEPRIKILHVVGSPMDEFNFNLNIFYSSSFDTARNADFDHEWCIIRPSDKKWAFAQNLDAVVDLESHILKKNPLVEWFDMPMALNHITTTIRPTFVNPHLFCIEGATFYRGLFEALKIPFIGSRMHQVVLAMNKVMTRGVMMECEIPCPPGKIVQADTKIRADQLEFPCVVKPTTTENSVGMTLVKAPRQLKSALELAFKYSKDVIVDRFIEGREIRCSVIERVLPDGSIELIPLPPQEYHISTDKIRLTEDKLLLDQNGIPLDKAPTTKTSFLSASEEPELIFKIQSIALKAHKALQFRDFSMYDFRVDAAGNPWVLEANLFCSFGPKSILSIQALHIGIDDKALFDIMANNVIRRSSAPAIA